MNHPPSLAITSLACLWSFYYLFFLLLSGSRWSQSSNRRFWIGEECCPYCEQIFTNCLQSWVYYPTPHTTAVHPHTLLPRMGAGFLLSTLRTGLVTMWCLQLILRPSQNSLLNTCFYSGALHLSIFHNNFFILFLLYWGIYNERHSAMSFDLCIHLYHSDQDTIFSPLPISPP